MSKVVSTEIPTLTNLEEQLKEAYRELQQRKRVYKNLVMHERMTQELADTRIRIQESIVETVRRACEAANPQARLFS